MRARKIDEKRRDYLEQRHRATPSCEGTRALRGMCGPSEPNLAACGHLQVQGRGTACPMDLDLPELAAKGVGWPCACGGCEQTVVAPQLPRGDIVRQAVLHRKGEGAHMRGEASRCASPACRPHRLPLTSVPLELTSLRPAVRPMYGGDVSSLFHSASTPKTQRSRKCRKTLPTERVEFLAWPPPTRQRGQTSTLLLRARRARRGATEDRCVQDPRKSRECSNETPHSDATSHGRAHGGTVEAN